VIEDAAAQGRSLRDLSNQLDRNAIFDLTSGR